jgi:Ulp1 family protease
MEIKEFRDSRNSRLDEFRETYNSLKSQYSSTLLAAIQESDPEKQQELVNEVLSINSEMSSELRSIISDLNKKTPGFDPKTLEELTNDLIEYQKQYHEIQEGKDRLQTLKIIQADNQKKLNETRSMFNMYLLALIILTILVAILVLRSPFVTTIGDTIKQTTSSIMQRQ